MKFLLITFIFIAGCDYISDSDDNQILNSLDIYDIWKQNTPLEQDSSGYYHYDYPDDVGNNPSDYGSVKYFTEIPTTRVFWNSPDSFWVYFQGQWIGEPIINNSTYSGDDGYGTQLFYVYPLFFGDTLSIYGSISDSIFDSVFVIIEN